MKLSCLPVSLFGDIIGGNVTLGEWAEYAESIGLDGYDVSSMFFPNHTATTLLSLKEQIKNVKIPMIMMTAYPDFSNPDEMERERQIDYMYRDIALASYFGIKYIRITAGQNHPSIRLEDGVAWVVDCFKRVAKRAEFFGITLLFENHAKPGAWPLVDFSFNPDAFLAIYEGIKGTTIGINFDTANAAACGANVSQLLDKVMDKVVTIHMNDTMTVGYLSSCRVGTGIVDFDSVFDVLKKHNFDGYVCIEEASNGGFEGTKKAVEFARQYVK